MSPSRPRWACYWGCACGGCDVSLLDTARRILEVADKVDLVFWPIVLDTKLSDVEAMEDGSIDVVFFNGAIRNEENLHVARLLRKKAKTLVAFGACAQTGGVHGLINTTDTESVAREVYLEGLGLDNPSGVRPQTRTESPEGTLELPALFDRVTPLSSVVQVDATVPGCPPNPERLNEVLDVLLSGKAIPNDAVVGASERALCETCPRVKKGLKVEGFRRPHLSQWDPEVCFMDQGLVCLGPVTRSGCGEACIRGNMPCTGCYGTVPHSGDAGAAMVGALAGRMTCRDMECAEVTARTLDDPLGTLYRFTYAPSSLQGRRPS